MEEELIAQRNAAIAVSKQLQHQLLSHDARIERNALNAEKLRLQSQYNYEVKSLQLNFQSKKFHRHLQIVVYSFILGALLSWLTSLCFTILFELPILGHLLFLPLHVLFTSIYYFHQKTQMDRTFHFKVDTNLEQKFQGKISSIQQQLGQEETPKQIELQNTTILDYLKTCFKLE